MSPIDNVSRRRRAGLPTDCDDLEVVKLVNVREQLEREYRRENDELLDEVARLEQENEEARRDTARLEGELAQGRRLCHEAKVQLASRDKENQQLLSRLKDQSSRIAELETYKLKYESYKNSKAAQPEPSPCPQPLSPTVEQKQLRVALADSQFELKKLAEDTATYKTLTEMEKVRMSKDHESKLTALRRQMEDENANWLRRFDQRDKEHALQAQTIRRKADEDRDAAEARMRAELANLRKLLESDKETRVRLLEQQLEDDRKRAQERLSSETSQLKRQYEQKIQELTGAHSAHIQSLER